MKKKKEINLFGMSEKLEYYLHRDQRFIQLIELFDKSLQGGGYSKGMKVRRLIACVCDKCIQNYDGECNSYPLRKEDCLSPQQSLEQLKVEKI